MAFDPALPANNAPVVAAELRQQFAGLHELIQSIPPGEPGPPGPPFASVVVDGMTTLGPGENATVSSSFDGTNVHLSFGIPQGAQGPAGSPFTSFVVDGVTTLNPGEPATVQTSFDGTSVRFVFGLPRGAPFTNFVVGGVSTLNPGENATAEASFDGTSVRLVFGLPRGSDGGQGPMGDVSQAQLNATIAGTALNTNEVANFPVNISDPPTQAEVQQIAEKLNELITALRRPV